MVGEHSFCLRRSIVRTTGGSRRDPADLSSDKCSENLHRRKPKVSWGRFVRPGLVGPKSRLKGVDDGELVNIPAPPDWCYAKWGRRRIGHRTIGCAYKPVGGLFRKIRRAAILER